MRTLSYLLSLFFVIRNKSTFKLHKLHPSISCNQLSKNTALVFKFKMKSLLTSGYTLCKKCYQNEPKI